jgi:hypothetical protein
LPRDIRNLNDALEAIEEVAVHTTQGSFVKTEDVKRLLSERREVLEEEFKERVERRIPYRMPPERARRMAMRDESLKEDHSPPGPREPGKSVPAGPTASEGVKS